MRRPNHGGFTLIELMIAVCIVGVLASIALPAFNGYIMQSRAAEVPGHLSTMYRGLAAYWEAPFASARDVGATAAGHCVPQHMWVDPADLGVPPFPPGPEKRSYDYSQSPTAMAIGFNPQGGVYGTYATGTPNVWGDDSHCNLKEADFGGGTVLNALGIIDLDGDNLVGGMSLDVGLRGEQLYRAPGYGSVADGLFQVFGVPCPQCAPGQID